MDIQGQDQIIEIEGWIYPKEGLELKNDQFVFLDFWATWCLPCMQVKPHLDYLQKNVSNEVVFLAMSNENKHKIESFVAKNHFPIPVVQDYQDKTFNKYKVESLPDALLLSPQGEIIWRGHPSELSLDKLKSLIHYNRSKNPEIQRLVIKKRESTNEIHPEKKWPSSKVDFKGLTIKTLPGKVGFSIFFEEGNTILRGTLSQIFSYLTLIREEHICCDNESCHHAYQIEFNGPLTADNKYIFIHKIAQDLNLQVFNKEFYEPQYIIKAENHNSFWSKEIFEFSDSDLHTSIISDEGFLEADNMDLFQLAYFLSVHLDKNFTYKGTYNKQHDWSLETSSISNLAKQLKEEYGLKIEETIYQIPGLIIR